MALTLCILFSILSVSAQNPVGAVQGVDAVPAGNCYTESGVFVSGDVVGDEGEHWCCVGFVDAPPAAPVAGTWTSCDKGSGGSGDVTAVGAGCADGECWTDGVVTTGTVMWSWEGTTSDAREIQWTNPADPSSDLTFVVTDPTTTRTITFPDETGTVCIGQTGAGCPAGGGDVTGLSASLDNQITRFHLTDGKVIQGYTSNGPTVDDTGLATFRNDAASSSPNTFVIRNLDTSASPPQGTMILWQTTETGDGSAHGLGRLGFTKEQEWTVGDDTDNDSEFRIFTALDDTLTEQLVLSSDGSLQLGGLGVVSPTEFEILDAGDRSDRGFCVYEASANQFNCRLSHSNLAEGQHSRTWDSAPAGNAFNGMSFLLNWDATADAGAQNLVRIIQSSVAGDATGTPDSLLLIETLEVTADDGPDAALEIRALTAGTMPVAIDVSDDTIGTAIAIGGNLVTVDGKNIQASEFGILDGGIDGSEVSTGTVPADRVGAAHIDAITEVAAALKTGDDLEFVTGTAGATNDCAKWDVNGDLITSGAGCGGTTNINDLGNATGTGVVLLGPDEDQTWIWDSGATAEVAMDGLSLQFNHDATSGTEQQRGLLINRGPTDGTTAFEQLLTLANSDADAAAVVDIAIKVLAAGGGITTALDVADADVINVIRTTTAFIDQAEMSRLNGIDAPLVDLDDSPTWSADHTFTGTITLPINAADQTVEAQLDYDSTEEVLELGDDGVATHKFFPVDAFTANNFCTADATLNNIDCDQAGALDDDDLSDDNPTALNGVITMTDGSYCRGNASTAFDCDVPQASIPDIDHLDSMGEFAAGIKRGPDATDTHLLTTDVAAPGALTCLNMDTDGSVVLAAGACAAAGGSDIDDVGPGCATGACWTDGLETTGTVMWNWEGTVANTDDFFFTVPADPDFDVEWVLTQPTTARVVTFPDEGGTVCIGQTGAGCPAGGGDVTGLSASLDNEIARFHLTDGKVIQGYTSDGPTVGDTGDVVIKASGLTVGTVLPAEILLLDGRNAALVDLNDAPTWLGLHDFSAGATVSGSNTLTLAPATGTAFLMNVEDTTDDLRIFLSTSSNENVEFINTGTGLLEVFIETTDGVLTDLKDAAHLTAGTVPVGRVGAAHIDLITEVAAGLKTGDDLEFVTGTATVGECGQFDANGDLIGAGAACGTGGGDDITVQSPFADPVDPIFNDTVTIAVTAVDTTTDEVTWDFRPSGVDGPIWGNDTTSTWVFDVGGATNPTLAFTDDSLVITGAATFTVNGLGLDEDDLSGDLITALSGVTTVNDGSYCQGGAASTMDCDVLQQNIAGADHIDAATEIADNIIGFEEINYTQSTNPTMEADEVWLGQTGIIFEGDVDDTDEMFLQAAAEVGGDVNVVIPWASVTLAGCGTDLTLNAGLCDVDALPNLTGTLDVDSGGSGAVTFTDFGVLVGSAANPFTALAAGTNGQLLIGSTGADPVFALPTSTNGIDFFVGAGTLEMRLDTSELNSISEDTAPPVNNGGMIIDNTGDGTNITHDMLTFRAGAEDFFVAAAREYPTVSNSCLVLNTGNDDLEWSGTSCTAGGAGSSWDITDTDDSPIQTVDDTEEVQFAAGADMTVTLTADGSDHVVTFAVDTLPNLTGTLDVDSGGTGATTFTDGGILIGNAGGAIVALGEATNGQIPIGDGTTDPVLGVITAEAGAELIVTLGAGTIEIDLTTPVDQGDLDGDVVMDNEANTYTSGSQDFSSVTTVFAANDILSSEIATEVRSMQWGAGSWHTQNGCADATEVAIPAGANNPEKWTVKCTDSDAAQATDSTFMPNGWDAGTVQFFLSAHHATSEALTCLYDVGCQCVGDGEAYTTTFTSETATTEISLVFTTLVDQTQSAGQSGGITCTGTCAASDEIRWELEVDAAGSGANCANVNLTHMKMEHTTNVGD